MKPEKWLELAISGGDDYELAFTAPPSARTAVQAAAAASATRVTRIGQIEAEAGVRLANAQGVVTTPDWASFDHFA